MKQLLAEAFTIDPAVLAKQAGAWVGIAIAASASSWAIVKARGGVETGVFWALSALYRATIGKVFAKIASYFNIAHDISDKLNELIPEIAALKNTQDNVLLPMVVEVHDRINKSEAIDKMTFNKSPELRFEFRQKDLHFVHTTELLRAVLGVTRLDDLEGLNWQQFIHQYSVKSYMDTLYTYSQKEQGLAIHYKDLFLRDARGDYAGHFIMSAEPIPWKNGKTKVHYYGSFVPADETTLQYVESVAFAIGVRHVAHPCILNEEGNAVTRPKPTLPAFLEGTVGQMGGVELITSRQATQPVTYD